jgi:translation initiation factor IF-1
MPKNLTGGNKAKKGSNKEGGKSVKNRHMVEDLIDDITNGEIVINGKDSEIFVGKVEKKLGNGRFHVWLNGESFIDASIIGRMTGKGGKVWIDVGNIVVVDRGRPQDGALPHIIAVFDAKNIQRLKKIRPDMDDRFFTAANTEDGAEAGFEFDRSEEKKDGEDSDSDSENAESDSSANRKKTISTPVGKSIPVAPTPAAPKKQPKVITNEIDIDNI